MSEQKQQEVATQQPKTVIGLLSNEMVKKRFADIMGKNSASFISSIISATKSNPELLNCDPDSVISSAVIAATLNLPIQSNLGFAHIVPYNTKTGKFAQFQMGWKGYVQLALRTGQYKTINTSEIYEGELIKHDRISGDVEIDTNKKKSDRVVGYVAYFKFINGFEKSLYWTKEQVEKHGGKYSKSYKSEYGRWKLDFDSMAIKTVIKQLLSKYGILSVEMQTAITTDQAIIKNADTLDVEYIDANEEEKPVSNAMNVKEGLEIEIKSSDKQLKMDEASKNNPTLNFDKQ